MDTYRRKLWIGCLVQATVCNDTLAYHRTQSRTAMGCREYAWTVTHLGTRRAIAVASTWQRARKAIERLLDADIDWNKAAFEGPDREIAKRVVDELVAEEILSATARGAGFPARREN